MCKPLLECGFIKEYVIHAPSVPSDDPHTIYTLTQWTGCASANDEFHWRCVPHNELVQLPIDCLQRRGFIGDDWATHTLALHLTDQEQVSTAVADCDTYGKEPAICCLNVQTLIWIITAKPVQNIKSLHMLLVV